MIKKPVMIFIFILMLISCNKNSNNDKIVTKNNLDDNSNIIVDQLEDNDSSQVNYSPMLKKGNKKYNIAIIRSGEYYMYADNLRYIIETFIENGWMKDVEFSNENSGNVEDILEVIVKDEYSEYLNFSKDLYFDFNWKKESESNIKYRNIINNPDVDLILSFGTVASQSARENIKNIPVVVTAVSDPVKSGIINSINDSGQDNITAFTDPGRFERQVKLFHSIINFKKLGLLYTDTVAGKTYAAYDDVNKIAAEKGFEIISATNLIEEDNDPSAKTRYIKALKELAPKVDAIYLTIQAGLTIDNMKEVMNIINKYKLPTFAMEGSEFVHYGALFSISAYELRSVGDFNAKNCIQILKGKKPGDLNMIFNITPSIAVNLKEAELIDFDVPVDILSSADQVFTEIAD